MVTPKKTRKTLCYGTDKKRNSYLSQSLVQVLFLRVFFIVTI